MKKALFLVLAVVMVLSMALCAQAEDTIKIGFAFPMSGTAAMAGKYSSHGAQVLENELGGKIEITLKDGQKRIETCRFIDEYHTEIGKWLYHICEFAERLEQNGDSIKPLTPPLEAIPGKEKTNADISR